MAIFYSVVNGDPLDSGGNSQVIEGSPCSTIEGEDGRVRMQTFLGQRAYCDVCKSAGVIVAAPGSPDTLRMYDEELRAHEALGGDLVFCKCERHPHVISVHGRSVMIVDDGGANRSARDTSIASSFAIASESIFDERFVLRDGSGNGLANTYYTIRLPSGELRHGTTDSEGRTARYQTNGARDIAVHVGHKQEA